MVLALVRPGYLDGTGASLSGSDKGSVDNWPQETITEIGMAIERLLGQISIEKCHPHCCITHTTPVQRGSHDNTDDQDQR
jgi:hypothetical protein